MLHLWKTMYVLEGFVCQEAWTKPAIAPHPSTWPSNNPSCKNKGDYTAPSFHISYKELVFLALWQTDKTRRQTDTSLHVIFSFFWHTLGWLCTFQLCRGCWPPACLQSAAGESPGTPGRTFWEHHKSHQWQRGRACIFPAPLLTNFHWDELAGSQWQLLPAPTTAKAKKRNWVNNFQE